MPIIETNLHIQCKHNGLTGTFLRNDAGELQSPIFADSVELYAFAKARGWYQDAERRAGWSRYFRNDETPGMVAVADLQPGDMLDLQDDPYADKTEADAPNPFEFELAVVEATERETADCIVVYSDLINCGFPPDHTVKVMGFEGRMVEGVTGRPAELTITRLG